MAKGRKTGGRRPGSPNRVTRELREIVRNALDAVGGQSYLERIAVTEPRAFLGLVGRIIPQQVKAEIEGGDRPLRVQVITGFEEGPHVR